MVFVMRNDTKEPISHLRKRLKPGRVHSRLVLAGVTLACVDRPAFAIDDWTPNRDDIAKVEAQVTFPNVQQYARYYLGFLNANTGKSWIKGEMIKPKREGDLPPGIYIVPRLPTVREGTCDVVHVTYVVEPAKVIFRGCGGPP
jgi:hypothetical protein